MKNITKKENPRYHRLIDCFLTSPFTAVRGSGSLVVKVSDRGWLVTSSIPVPLKIRRVEARCTLYLSRAQTSSRWSDVVVRRGGCQLRCCPHQLTMVQNDEVLRPKPSCN
ncbi:uncharacterized protein TNCV_5041891 [Trichonephila clavipes]|nr:uncharacterized protein TNCV_5041891 [Trichonephila clavipes]